MGVCAGTGTNYKGREQGTGSREQKKGERKINKKVLFRGFRGGEIVAWTNL